MHLSYFDLTVPVFKKNLLIAQMLLQKGLDHALETGMSETDFLEQRLAPDMFPLIRQVQIVTDNAKGATSRLTGIEAPVITDTETSVAELISRIDTVIAYLDTFTHEQFTNAAEQKIMLPYVPDQYQTGADYFKDFVQPNFFFHMTMIYALVRAQGTSVGKMDFIGNLNLHPVS